MPAPGRLGLLVRILPAGLIGAAVLSGVRSLHVVSGNDWFGLGLERLAFTRISEITASTTAAVLAATLVVVALYMLIRSRSPDAERARAILSAAFAMAIAAAVIGPWGFRLNRYTYKEFWLPSNAREVFGVKIPAALLAPEVLLADVGLAFLGVVLAIVVFLVLRPILRWSGSTAWFDGRAYQLAAAMSVLLLVAAVIPGLVAGPDDPSSPNVILVSLDTLRADHLGCYGYPLETSPSIDSLAAEGVLFENVVAQSNWTLPSHMSMMTSQIPSAHGVENINQRLVENKVTLAEILKNAGYHTFAITGGYNVDQRFGFDQGFDEYLGDEIGQVLDEEKVKYGQGRRLATQLPRAYARIEDSDGPFFLFLHAWDTHAPYMPHDGIIETFSADYQGDVDMVTHEYMQGLNSGELIASEADIRRIRALYDNEIRHVDNAIGELVAHLKRRGVFDNTILILTSDHGDELMEHGIINHRVALYQPEVFVPLIVTYPNRLRAGERVEVVARSIDIVPTVLALAGVPVSRRVQEQFQGRSLVGSWDGELAEVAAVAQGPNGMHALRFRELKYIRTRQDLLDEDELFDLSNDPEERENLSREIPETLAAMELQLDRQLESLSRDATPGESLPQDEEFLEKLRSLGYVQ